MADIVSVMRRADNLNTSPQFDSYSRVKIFLNDDDYVTAGDDTGRTMEIENPWGTHNGFQNFAETSPANDSLVV